MSAGGEKMRMLLEHLSEPEVVRERELDKHEAYGILRNTPEIEAYYDLETNNFHSNDGHRVWPNKAVKVFDWKASGKAAGLIKKYGSDAIVLNCSDDQFYVTKESSAIEL